MTIQNCINFAGTKQSPHICFMLWCCLSAHCHISFNISKSVFDTEVDYSCEIEKTVTFIHFCQGTMHIHKQPGRDINRVEEAYWARKLNKSSMVAAEESKNNVQESSITRSSTVEILCFSHFTRHSKYSNDKTDLCFWSYVHLSAQLMHEQSGADRPKSWGNWH